jgi:hypothetical protein
MSTPIDRRTLLKRAAAASLILGFPFLAAAEEKAAEPERCRTPDLARGVEPFAPADPAPGSPVAVDAVLRQAAGRMRREGKPGVVLLAPADAGPAAALARQLEGLIHSDSSAVHQAFCEAVFLCLPASEAGRFAGRRAEWGLVLVDADHKAVDGLALEVKEDFGAKVLALLHGPDGGRLRTAAAAQREALDVAARDGIDGALADLSHRDYRKREAAADRLADVAPRAMAVLAEAVGRAESPEALRGLQATFTRLFRAAAVRDRAPYGTAWVEEQVDPCPACGMSRLPPRSRTYLRLTCEGLGGGTAEGVR